MISTLTIKGFRGISEEIPFKFGAITLLAGRNGLGKTTVFDAIDWCLFGSSWRLGFDTESIRNIYHPHLDPVVRMELHLPDKKLLIERTAVSVFLNGSRISDRDLVETLMTDPETIAAYTRDVESRLRRVVYLSQNDIRALVHPESAPERSALFQALLGVPNAPAMESGVRRISDHFKQREQEMRLHLGQLRVKRDELRTALQDATGETIDTTRIISEATKTLNAPSSLTVEELTQGSRRELDALSAESVRLNEGLSAIAAFRKRRQADHAEAEGLSKEIQSRASDEAEAAAANEEALRKLAFSQQANQECTKALNDGLELRRRLQNSISVHRRIEELAAAEDEASNALRVSQEAADRLRTDLERLRGLSDHALDRRRAAAVKRSDLDAARDRSRMLRDRQREEEELIARASSLTDEITKLGEERDSLRLRLREAREEMKRRRDEYGRLSRDEAIGALRVSQEAADRLRTDLERLRGLSDHALDRRRAAAVRRSDLDAARDRSRMLRDRQREEEELIARASSLTDEITKLGEERDSLRLRLREAREEMKRRRDEYDSLSKTASTSDALESLLRQAVSMLPPDLSECPLCGSPFVSRQELLQHISGAREQYALTSDALSRALATLQAQQEVIGKLQRELRDADEKLAAMEKDKGQCDESLQRVREVIATFPTQIESPTDQQFESADAELRSIDEELKRLKDDIDDRTTRLGVAQDDVSRASTRLETVKQQINEAQRNVEATLPPPVSDALSRALATLQAQQEVIGKLQRELRDADEKLAAMEKDKGQCDESLQRVREVIATFPTQIESPTDQQFESADAELRSIDEELKRLKDDIDDRTTRLGVAQDDVSRASTRLETVKQQITEARQNVDLALLPSDLERRAASAADATRLADKAAREAAAAEKAATEDQVAKQAALTSISRRLGDLRSQLFSTHERAAADTATLLAQVAAQAEGIASADEVAEWLEKRRTDVTSRLVTMKRIWSELVTAGAEERSKAIRVQCDAVESELATTQSSLDMLLKAKSRFALIADELRKTAQSEGASALRLQQQAIQECFAAMYPHGHLNEVVVGDNPLGEVRVTDKLLARGVEPMTYLSTGQANVLGLSIFTGIALRQRLLRTGLVCLDEPIQHLDDLHFLGFVSLLKRIGLSRQVLLSTADANVAQIITRQMESSWAELPTDFIRYEWNSFDPEAGPKIVMRTSARQAVA
jgi:DNA repair exonuclease SbcCD ATPase subunit